MIFARYIPTPIKAPLRRAFTRLYTAIRPPPEEVVKANTAQAFNYFWRRRDFVNRWYLEPQRLRLYEQVADYCRDLLQETPDRQPKRVLDAGCGTGHLLQVLHRQLSSNMAVELEGIDFSRVAIRQARRLVPNARFSVQNIRALTLGPGTYDLVVCMETLEHLKDPDTAMRGLTSIVRAGGRIVLTVPDGEHDRWDGHVNFWTLPQLAQWLDSFGKCRVDRLDGALIAQLIPKEAAINTPRMAAA